MFAEAGMTRHRAPTTRKSASGHGVNIAVIAMSNHQNTTERHMRTFNQKWKASYSTLSCSCWIEGDESHIQLRYPRHTKLGARIAIGLPDPARPVLANYLRQELGLPRGDNATPVSFVGV